MKKQLLISLCLLLALPSLSEAQHLRARWKAYRYEYSFGLGITNFLGELGGANQIGTHGFKDLEFKETRPAVVLGFRYKVAPSLAFNTHLSYGQVRGDDKLTTEYFRNRRNLNFKSNIFEFNLNMEASLLSQREGGIYRLRGVHRSSSFEASLYGFIGIGIFHFNPKGQFNGHWYELQPLGTEGQDIDPARKKYKRTQLCIPIGIGGRYFFNRRWGAGFEFGVRQTFTDYIDDVSKTYYDKAALTQKNGPTSAILSDKSATGMNAGDQRGDPGHNDSYIFAVFSLHYKLRTGRTNFPIF
jgi:hypothetical protein